MQFNETDKEVKNFKEIGTKTQYPNIKPATKNNMFTKRYLNILIIVTLFSNAGKINAKNCYKIIGKDNKIPKIRDKLIFIKKILVIFKTWNEIFKSSTGFIKKVMM